MKVLLVAMKYDYGIPSRGPSGMDEYFLHPLQRIVDHVIEFDFMEHARQFGRAAMNAALLRVVEQERPEVALFVPYRDEFVPEVLERISRLTTTIGYLFDDVWRVSYSRKCARQFSYVTTSDVDGVERWRKRGCFNFIYSPFAVNCDVFRRIPLPVKYDVSFVGAYHPYREWLVRELMGAGLQVAVWGTGWPAGRLSLTEMIAVFNQSRINLNLSNNERFEFAYVCGGWSWRQHIAVCRSVARRLLRNDSKTREMVKGRHFEINACGGFQLTYFVNGLEQHYRIGQEIAAYRNVADLVAHARYYLSHEQERCAIASAGYDRTLASHRADLRLAELLQCVCEHPGAGVRRTP